MCFSPLFTPLVPFPEMPDPQAISYSFEILVLRVDLTARRGPRYILYSGNLDSTHQDCERRTLLGSFGRMLSGKIFKIEVL